MDTDVSFGVWIQKRRKALDLTREGLAKQIDCSVSVLRKIETDERRPSKQLSELFSQALDIPTDEHAKFIGIARGELSPAGLKSPLPLPDLSLVQNPQVLFNTIPTPPTPLMGRETELAALCQMLNDPQRGLTTLVGPGGIGETRLAIEVAKSLHAEYEQGVFFIPLAGVNSPNLIIAAITDTMDLKFHSKIDSKKQLLPHLQEKHILLVLDKIEHLLDGVSIIAEMIENAPQVKVLCTSREQLNLRGEWVFEVGGLNVPMNRGRDGIENYSAVSLFMQCASRVQADISLEPENQFAIGRICQWVGGMPLALELAAPWVRMLSCHEIAQEIKYGLEFLSSAARAVPDRHRSRQAVFDYPWKMLTTEEQSVLCQLAVFRSDFNREAAGQVAGASLTLLTAFLWLASTSRDSQPRGQQYQYKL